MISVQSGSEAEDLRKKLEEFDQIGDSAKGSLPGRASVAVFDLVRRGFIKHGESKKLTVRKTFSIKCSADLKFSMLYKFLHK